MKNLKDINKIRRLAKKFGTPLIDVTFQGEGVTITYQVGTRTNSHSYSDADRGIEEEVIRLEQLSKIEI